MDTNFDDQQAFEDLQSILSHMYAIANKFYDEAQKNAQAYQASIIAKDKTIADLNAQLATLEDLCDAFNKADNKISELESTLKKQGEDFTAHLQNYGSYNYELTDRLKNLEASLTEKKRNLDKREEELEELEQALNAENEKFRTEKFSMQAKIDAYNELQERYNRLSAQANKFDGDNQTLRNEYKEKIATLERERDKAWATVKTWQTEKETLEDKVKNLREQIQLKDEEISRIKGNGNTGEHSNVEEDML